MPYPSHQHRRIPTTRETIESEFARADGNVDVQGSYKKVVASTPKADVDHNVVDLHVELCCGCYWPDIEVGGVCAECVNEGVTPNVCKNHYFVCRCGTPCCWQHSKPTDDGPARLCARCHLREKNKQLKANVLDMLKRAARRIFFK